MWRSLTDALKARELIMDFIEPVSMRAGICTPSRTQKTRGWRATDILLCPATSEAHPTEKIEGCSSFQPINEAPLGSLKMGN